MRAEDAGSGTGRRAAIDSILGVETSAGLRVGIYGADVCALCGWIDTFRGWVMAVYGCHFGPQREFVCRACRGRLIPDGVTSMSERERRVRTALARSRVRYCRLCESEIERDPLWGKPGSGKARVCEGCRSELRDRGATDEQGVVEFVRARRRRRFLELLAPDELVGMGKLVGCMRDELETMEVFRRLGGH